MASPSEETKRGEMDGKGSQHPIVVLKRGNGPSRTPGSEGGAASWRGGWKHAEDVEPRPRVTAKPPGRVRDSARRDEPDAFNAHVRICGSPREQSLGRPGPEVRNSCPDVKHGDSLTSVLGIAQPDTSKRPVGSNGTENWNKIVVRRVFSGLSSRTGVRPRNGPNCTLSLDAETEQA